MPGMQQIATAVFMGGKMAGGARKSKGAPKRPIFDHWAGAGVGSAGAAGSAGGGFSGGAMSAITSGVA